MTVATETRVYQINLSPKDTENVYRALDQLKGIIDEIDGFMICEIKKKIDLEDLMGKIYFQAEAQGGWIC